MKSDYNIKGCPGNDLCNYMRHSEEAGVRNIGLWVGQMHKDSYFKTESHSVVLVQKY